jgi:hypothetical protein
MQPFNSQPAPANRPSDNSQPSTFAVPFTIFSSLAVLQQATLARFCKAVNSLTDGSLAVTITRHTETEIRALAKNGTGKEYGVTLTAAGAFCSCPDSLYRGTTCKHATALALFVLQLPPAEARPAEAPAAPPQPPARRTYQLGDTVSFEGKTGRVIAVSGDFISVWWDSGRRSPVTRQQLETAPQATA